MLRYGDVGRGEESKGQWRFNTPTPPTRTIYFYVPIIFGPTKSNIEEKMDIIKPVTVHCLFLPLIKRSFLVDGIPCQRSTTKTSW